MALYSVLAEEIQDPTASSCCHGNASARQLLIVTVVIQLRTQKGQAARLLYKNVGSPPFRGDPVQDEYSRTENSLPPENATATRARSSSACWIFSATTFRISCAVLETFAFTLT